MKAAGAWAESATVLLACLTMLAGGELHAQSGEQSSLEAVRREIGALESRLARERAERDRAAEALKRAELDIAAARSALARIERLTGEQEQRAEALAAEQAGAAWRMEAERAVLAELARVAYMNGRRERLKLLLSQERPADLGRMQVYYEYFHRERTRRIRAVAEELDRLAELGAETERVHAELEALARARAEELEALDRSRAERRALLDSLEASLASGGGEIERLREEEKRLAALVTELGELLAAFPADSEEPFPRLKGRLAWPVPGEVVAGYGTPRGGGLRSNGVLLSASRGTAVRAIYHGRVAFADWLPGLGLLAVLDHGDGYMSLYAHNEALLKEPGDWVRPGEPIAEVGDTGGRAAPALYFEIRHAGEPVDPRAWIAR